jgi:transcriptional regulator with XRE-family HTH domain
MTPEELRTLRKSYGLSQRGLAELMGSTRESVGRWERGVLRVKEPWVRLAFRVLDLERQLADADEDTKATEAAS